MASERINARLTAPLAAHVARVVGHHGDYETPSEYVRALIREDMNRYESNYVRRAIREGYIDVAEGRYFLSTGDFTQDMALLDELEGSDRL
jgi:antitoxin ParD1/3/4